MNLSIHIPQFEGPLGLLLYLIRKEEMDIFDIDVHLITSQYLDYIKKMKQFDLEVAGDFISMAATLIQIKSKMLLPNYNEEGEEEDVIDPRKELVQKLVEYQKFQEISKQLYDRPLLGRDVFRRGKSESIHSDEEGEIILDEGGLFSLIAFYRNSVRKMKKAIHRVARKSRSIAGRIMEIKDRLIVGQRVVLADLINTYEEKKAELLITFLSSLELGKMGLVSVYQSDVYGDIYLTAKKPITPESIGRVEEYDSGEAEQVASNLMDEAEEQQILSEETGEGQLGLSQQAEDEEESYQALASDEEIAAAEMELGEDALEVSDPVAIAPQEIVVEEQPMESLELRSVDFDDSAKDELFTEEMVSSGEDLKMSETDSSSNHEIPFSASEMSFDDSSAGSLNSSEDGALVAATDAQVEDETAPNSPSISDPHFNDIDSTEELAPIDEISFTDDHTESEDLP
ncbi:MAG: segregation/condensation protein A [Pseudomonadota bacterium]